MKFNLFGLNGNKLTIFKKEIEEIKTSMAQAQSVELGQGNSISGFSALIQAIKGVKQEITTLPKTSATQFFTDYNNAVSQGTNVTSNYLDTIKKTNSTMADYLAQLNGAKPSYEDYIAYCQRASKANKNLNKTSKLAAIGVGILNSAINVGVIWLLTNGIELLIDTIDKLRVTNEEYLEQQEEIISKAEETISSTKSEIDSLENLQKKLQETNGSQLEMLTLSKEVDEILGDGASSILNQADAYDVLNAKIERNIELKKQEQEKANKEKKEALKNTINKAEISNSGMGSDLTFRDLKSSSADYNTKTIDEYFKELLNSAKESGETIDTVEEYSELWRQASKKMQDDGNLLFLPDSDKNWLVYSVPSEEELQDYFDTVLPNVYKYFKNEINNNSSFFASGDIKNIVKDMFLQGYGLDTIQKTLDDLLSNTDLQEAWSKFSNAFNNNDINQNALYKNFISQIDKIKETYPYLSTTIDDYVDYLYSQLSKKTVVVDDVNKSTFSDIFNSSEFSEQKEALLELAKAGELTNEALASDDYKDLINALDGIGISTNQAKNEILSLLDSTEKLSGASKVISGLEDAYNEFSESGYVSAETIESIPDIFRELETYDFDLFKNIIGNPDSEIDEVQQAFNEIVSAYINEQGTLMNVSEQEASRFIHNLEKMGIVNAKAIVDSVTALKGSLVELEKEADSTMESLNTFLIKQGKDAVTSTDDITQCTWSELEALIRVGGQYGFNTDKIKEYVTKKIWCNQNSIDATADINQLIIAAKAAGLAADSIAIYEKAKELHNKGYGGGKEWLESMEQSVYKDILKEIETLYKIKSEKYNPTDNETKSSDPWKEEFDRYLSDLKHRLEMDEITQAQYLNTLDALNKKYFKDKAEYLEEYWQYEEEVYKGYLSLQEQASDAIHNLVDLRIDMIKHELKKELEAEKEKLDLLNEQIDARKEAIELLKDERDHAEEMAEKNKAISDIQNEINALKYDDSAAAQKKRRELEEELAEAEKDLTDYIRDYEYNQAIDALDKEAEEAEKAYEEKEKSIQEHLDDEKRLLGEAINDINGMNETLYDNMKTWALETTGEVWKVVEAWKAAQEALDTYNAKSKVPEIDETLHNNITNETVVDNAAGTVPVTIYKKDGSTVTEFDSVGGNSGNNSNSNSNAGSNNNNNTDLNNKSYKAIHTIKSKDDTLWSLAEKYYGDGNKWKKISEANGNIKPEELTIGKKLYIPYKHGTTKVPDDTLALVDEVGQELILRANEQGRLDILTKGTSVIPANITEKLMMWGQQSPTSFAQCLSTKLSSMSLPDIISRETAPVISIGDININGNMGNLTRSDLNEFRKGIVNDVYESMQKNRVKSGRY